MTIKEIRTACHMTQAAFAKELGIPKRTIENWELEKRAPHDYIVELIHFRMAETIEKNNLHKGIDKSLNG